MKKRKWCKRAAGSSDHLCRCNRVRVIGMVLGILVCYQGSVSAQATGEVSDSDASGIVFNDELQNGFMDWSWTNVNTGSQELRRTGTRSIAVTYEPWGGVYLVTEDAINLAEGSELVFWAYANDEGPVSIAVTEPGQGETTENRVSLEFTVGQWKEYRIPMSDFGNPGSIDGIWWQEAAGMYRARIYLDDIAFTGGINAADDSSNDDTPMPAESGVSITVNTGNAELRRSVINPATNETRTYRRQFPATINEDIYGINFAPNLLREELRVPVNRWGGNATERYNFKTSSSNQANDWFYANNAGEVDAHHNFERDNQADGTATLLTLPAIGWVSSNRSGTCSFPIDQFGDQDAQINHWLEPNTLCGNGYLNGEFIGPADPELTSIAVDETFAGEWVAEMVRRHGTAAEGGVEMYAIGNEPGLWHYTHGDVRSNPMTRQKFVDLNIRYAKEVKKADATAEVLGPVLWSGSSYYVSSDELLNGVRPGEVPVFLEDYLLSMKNAGEAEGTRLLDRLAINFYDDRVYQGGSDALRLESTRQLWDPTYAPADWWVVRDFLHGNGSAVIPRMKSLIDETYPGTPMAITEYNFGGVDDGAGALAQIDVLGIFGREGLDMATLWEPYADYVTTPVAEFANRPVFWAFRLYRNYDGNGGQFGNIALLTESSDESKVSAYAAKRSESETTIMLVNKEVRDQSISLNGVSGNAQVFRYLGSNPQNISSQNNMDVANGSRVLLPARSATLLVLDGG